MFYTSAEKYIPIIFVRDNKLKAFVNLLNSVNNITLTETLALNHLIQPEKCPEAALDYLGIYINANLQNSDDSRIKRQKISKAIAGHKIRGSFRFDAKPKIDNICLGDSKIFRSYESDDFIFIGDSQTPDAYNWSVMGCDGIDLSQGISLIGVGDEIEVAGNIYIDVDNDNLSIDNQQKLRLEMDDIVPAYFFVHFGYINNDNQFVEYFIMGGD